ARVGTRSAIPPRASPRMRERIASQERIDMLARIVCAVVVITAAPFAFAQDAPKSNGSAGQPQDKGSCCHDANVAEDPALPLPMDRKSVILRRIADELYSGNAPFVGEGGLAENERKLRELPPNADAGQTYPLHCQIGDQLLAVGRIDDAIHSYE